uniref:Envelope glycoprotein L n=1 Tax=Heterorhabditis bacteriophora TaxID=37862 RepID=A0A1I7W9E5_HETBA
MNYRYYLILLIAYLFLRLFFPVYEDGNPYLISAKCELVNVLTLKKVYSTIDEKHEFIITSLPPRTVPQCWHACSLFFFIKSDTYTSVKDVTYDNYSPWSRKDAYLTAISEEKKLPAIRPKWLSETCDGLTLKLYRVSNPECLEFKKLVNYCISSHLNEHSSIVPPVIIQYFTSFTALNYHNSLNSRTLSQARRYLREKDIHIKDLLLTLFYTICSNFTMLEQRSYQLLDNLEDQLLLAFDSYGSTKSMSYSKGE